MASSRKWRKEGKREQKRESKGKRRMMGKSAGVRCKKATHPTLHWTSSTFHHPLDDLLLQSNSIHLTNFELIYIVKQQWYLCPHFNKITRKISNCICLWPSFFPRDSRRSLVASISSAVLILYGEGFRPATAESLDLICQVADHTIPWAPSAQSRWFSFESVRYTPSEGSAASFFVTPDHDWMLAKPHTSEWSVWMTQKNDPALA